jgi:hypothetical protein
MPGMSMSDKVFLISNETELTVGALEASELTESLPEPSPLELWCP